MALVIIPLVLTLVILVLGLLAMVAGDKVNKRYSNYLMRARVFMQLVTIICLALYVSLYR